MPNFSKDTGKFLTADDVATGDVITFTNEGEEVEKEFRGKTSKKIEIGVRLADGTEKTVTLNPTSRNLLVDYYKDQPLTDKDARIEVIPTMISGDKVKVVYVCPPNMDSEGKIVQSR